MKAIRKKLIILFSVFFACALLTAWFILVHMIEGIIAAGIASAVTLFFLLRQWKLLYDARLIADNRILTVPSATVTNGIGEIVAEETVVSTFGILLGDEVFKWGSDGRGGVKLSSLEIDRLNVTLDFGNKGGNTRVKLLHGLSSESDVETFKQKILHETGVEASVVDW